MSFQIPGGAEAPHRAREIVTLTIGASLPSPLVERAKLLISEVVTNSVMHGGSGEGEEIGVAVAWSPARIRMEVVDTGQGFRQTAPDPDRPGGWGLHLVETLSERWGIERSTRTLVWFELAPTEG